MSPSVDGRAELWLEGDLAAILSLAAGRKIPVSAEDRRALQSMGAGEVETLGQKRKNRPQGAVQANAPEVLTSLVAGAYNRHRLLHVAWDIFGDNNTDYPINHQTLLGIKPPMPG